MTTQMVSSLLEDVRRWRAAGDHSTPGDIARRLRDLGSQAYAMAREIETGPNRGARLPKREGISDFECRASLIHVLALYLRSNAHSGPVTVLYRAIEPYLGLRHLTRNDNTDHAFWRNIARGLTVMECNNLPELASFLVSRELPPPLSSDREVSEHDELAVRAYFMEALLEFLVTEPSYAAVFVALHEMGASEGLRLDLAQQKYERACLEREVRRYMLRSFVGSGKFSGSFTIRRVDGRMQLTLTPVGVRIAQGLNQRSGDAGHK